MFESIVDLLEVSCKKFGDRPLFGTRSSSGWSWLSYRDFEVKVLQCTAGLAGLGVNPGDRVGLVANNCVEWATAAHATYARGAAFVPMYTAQRPEEWSFIINDCGAKLVFAESQREYEALKQLVGSVESLQRVICFALPADHADSFEKLLADGARTPVARERPKRDDVAAYVYTSGTTGTPKGVKLSHWNFCSNCIGVHKRLPLGGARSLAFLPWAHAFGQTAELHYFVHEGAALAINDDVTRIVPNLSEVSPTVLVAVPRIFNRIYDGVHRQMSEKPKAIQNLFRSGLGLASRKNAGERLSMTEKLTLSLADKLIFSKVRGRFGGQLEMVISGSAALNPDVARFIDALGIVVYEGYGLTETSPVVSVNYSGHRKIGSVGKPLPEVRVEIDESRSDNPGEGELVVYGPNVMLGYHNRPDDNAAVFTSDGGFRTGDLGYVDGEGFVFITGRIKELYKLENGKYVAPALLEEQIKVSPYVAHAVLYGANKPHNVVLIVPDADALKNWAQKEGITVGDAAQNPRVKELVQGELQHRCKGFKSYEKPKDCLIITEDFTTDNGLLTPKMSVKRDKVIAKYQPQLDALY